MLRNHFTIALRNLRRHKLYTVINVSGLAVGMACCLLIGLYADDELSFDRFHAKADRLMVVGFQGDFFGRMTNTSYPLAPTLVAELPEVEQAVRTRGFGEVPIVRDAEQTRSERRMLLADEAFFEVFSFPLVRGDPATVLDAPDAAVLTEETARAYFGDEDPLGQTLHVERFDTTYTVTVRGIADAPPPNSTIQFDVVASLDLLPASQRQADAWGMLMYGTYLLLDDAASADALDDHIVAVVRKHADGEAEHYFAVPLASVYLSDLHEAEGLRGQTRYLTIFGSIALFVLLIAAINYVNLVTAQSTQRAREVGVRKTLGADRLQVARQFLGESVLLSVAALLLALALTALALPAFNALFGKALSLSGNVGTLLGLSAFVLAVGVAAGAYPAFVLSRFQPVQVLRGHAASAVGGGWLRKGLVVVQFTVTVALLVGTLVVYQQLRYVQTADLGFDGEQVVTVELPGDRAWRLREALRRDVLAHPGVAEATVASAAPAQFGIRLGMKPEEASSEAQAADPEESISFAPAVVDYDFVETLGLDVVAGRAFSREHPSDEQRAVLLNETAVRQLGWTPEGAVGKPFEFRDEMQGGRVIGVVEDFHLASLHEEVEPVLLQLHESESWSSGGVLIARLRPEDIPTTLGRIEAVVARYAPGEPFDYAFLDDTFDAMYRSEERLAQVFTSFAGLAILIACLGLFGLAAFTAERRTKEIGIRKTLGASVGHLVGLLSKDFLRLVLLAFVIAAPLAYLAMSRWLGEFAYQVEIGAGVFLLAGALALVIALATVSYHALRAATADPVRSLRSE